MQHTAMATLKPIQALRPAPEFVAEIVSVPYDVVNREEAAELAQGKSRSFLHVSRAEIDLPEVEDVYSEAVYRKAAENFQKMRQSGELVLDQEPAVYVYRLKMGDHVQTGVAATFAVDEYDRDVIKKHEKTRKAKEDDRTRHILTVGAQTGPVFLTYRACPKVKTWIEGVTRGTPLYDLTTPDGVVHTLWRSTDTGAVVEAFAGLETLYIADGHHRAASASRSRAEKAPANGDPANFFLAVAFADQEMKILPYHRLVFDLGGRTAEAFLKEVKARIPVTTTESADAPGRGLCCMYLDGSWYQLELKAKVAAGDSPARRLDAAVLEREVLRGILGIEDIRTDPRVDFVGGIRGTGELVKRVDSGEAAVAFSMAATGLDQLMAISDADEIMPPKSTWFEPKLRDGFLHHLI